VYALSGHLVWGMFISTIFNMSTVFLSQKQLIVKTSVSKISLALSQLGQVFYSTVVNAVVLVLVSLMFKEIPSWQALLLPLLLLPTLLLGISFGLIFSVINVIARDTSAIVKAFFGFFMSLLHVHHVLHQWNHLF
jgi:lipopolysaccharide transport system permease protein